MSASRRAWLIVQSGSSPAARFPVREGRTRIGRDPSCDLIIEGPAASVISGRHVDIYVDRSDFRIVDLDSRNGTFVDGRRVKDTRLAATAVIHLGLNGVQLRFEVELEAVAASEPTVALSPPTTAQPRPEPVEQKEDPYVSDAVMAVRRAHRRGISNQTGKILQKMLAAAIRRSSRKFRIAIAILVIGFAALAAAGYWRIRQLETEKQTVDRQIQEIDLRLAAESTQDPAELDRLAVQIEEYQARAQQLQDNILYRLGTLGRHDAFVQSEIKTLMKDFGAELYSIPPEFLAEVTRFIAQFQERDRAHVARVVGRTADVDLMRGVFTEQKLPADLVFISLVESALYPASTSPAGAVGPWQFTSATARAYGLRVEGAVDERTDLRKSTTAAGRYIRELILDFGAGSSVMLALAAYNTGPARVKRAIQRVDDPIRQRDFWYLYRVRALPIETRQYVPKIVAAIIVGRHPQRFGF